MAPPGVLVEAGQRARARWPAVEVDAQLFFDTLTARGIDPTAPGLQLEEMVLAFACARGDVGAITVFDREYIAKIPLFLARIEPDAEVVDEVRQRVRTRVLVAESPNPARIAEFGGRGPLGARRGAQRARQPPP